MEDWTAIATLAIILTFMVIVAVVALWLWR
jgi:hypothetical protein